MFLESGRLFRRVGLCSQILALNIFVVEFSIKILVVVHPASYHVRILFMEVNIGRSPIKKHWFIVAEVVCLEGLVTPEHHLAPQVGVLPAVVHRSVGLELIFDV